MIVQMIVQPAHIKGELNFIEKPKAVWPLLVWNCALEIREAKSLPQSIV
jgi:hypothetical protein